MPYDYVPPGKMIVNDRLVDIPEGGQSPDSFETIEQLRAQIKILQQRANSDELFTITRSLKKTTEELNHTNEEQKLAKARIKELEDITQSQEKTIIKITEEMKILRSSKRISRGEDPPPLTEHMKEVAALKKKLAAANRTIITLKASKKGK